MEKYLGVKLIEAEPAIKGWNSFENGEKNFSAEMLEEGYKVVYEDGYTSWSPKEVFEKAYMKIQATLPVISKELLPHQERVVIETKELDDKITKLDEFIMNNPIFKNLSEEDQNLMIQQVRSMQYYFGILVERINKF